VIRRLWRGGGASLGEGVQLPQQVGLLSAEHGHQVSGMHGLYAHASGRIRDDLKHAL
jgi:hypothetical protein